MPRISVNKDAPSLTSAERARRRCLIAELEQIGPFRRGSLLQVLTRCGTPGCRCRADPPRRHGPYWQWTRKVGGKTVTVRLTEEQAVLLRPWLENAKRWDQKLGELEDLFAEIADRLLAGVAER